MASRINADNGVVSGVSGINYTGDNSGVMALQTNGNTAITIDSSGNFNFSVAGQKVTGDFTNATLLNRVLFQTSTANSTTGIYAVPNGTSNAASWQATNNSDPTNASKILIATNGSTDVQLVSGRNGSGTYLPLSFYTNGTQQAQLDTSGNLTTVGYINSPNTFGFKNRIINGAMNIWQRGTSGFGPGGYGADRWYLDGTSATSSQSSDVPSTAFTYSNSWGYPGTASCSIRQRIESWNCKDLAGQNITVSFWAKSTAGTTGLSYSLSYPATTDNFSGISEGNIVSFVTITATPSTSWTYYTFTVAIPSAATTGLQLSFNRNSGGSATTLITGVQLEKGSTATSFDYRPYGTELSLCQRYCWVSYTTSGNGGPLGTGAVYSSTTVQVPVNMPVSMRTTPTVSTVLVSGSNWCQSYIGASGQNTNNTPAIQSDLVNYQNFRLAIDGFTGLTGGQASWTFTNPNAKLILSAEL